MTISERIFLLMQENDLSQSEFARRTGISTRTISDWKRKGTNPSADRIMCICEVLGVTPEELLSDEPLEARSVHTASSLRLENERLKQQLDEAVASNKAKETFLSNMSHDIRTPMNAIVGMTALAKSHIDEKSRVIDSLNKIETAGSHLLSLINEVLDMSRIESGRLQITSGRFSLGDLLHDVITIVQPQMAQKGHSYLLQTGDIPQETLFGDILRLRQIYVNIINNAVKYTPEGGRIELSVDEEIAGDRCLLTFACRDNGIGMSDDFLSRIFEPFERAGSEATAHIEGTGLGMSIVKRLIEAMDGSINITSSPGEGTDVVITIPLAFEDEPVTSEALAGKRVLLIETDVDMLRKYKEYFDGSGVSSTAAASAAEALSFLTEAEFRDETYDAVIIGRSQDQSATIFDTSEYLHHSRPGLPIILISDHNWDEIQYQANRAGIRHFIPLPVFRKSLIRGLTEVLTSEGPGEQSFGAPDLSGRHILLVEDNLINQEIACEVLRMTGAEVDTAGDGKQAVNAFLESPEDHYSLILMDVQMPVMNGYDATRKIRSLERADAASVPIYAMTANTFAEDIAKARESGMDGHLAKPIDIKVLMSTLRQAIK